MKFLLTMVQGFCMALADSVPGVSGGTIAFILGFYDRFITSLDRLVRGNTEDKKEAVKFLSKLICGWVIGFAGSVLVLGAVFNSRIYELCSLFLGLSLFSLPVIIREEQGVIKGNYQNLIFTGIGIAVVCLITYLNPSGTDAAGMDIAHLTVKTAVYIFLVAMVVISAMVLPGISGSSLLLIFGLYIPIVGGIREFLHGNFTYVPALAIFGLGVLTGIVTAIRMVKTGLEKYRSQMIYLILGLLTGSLYAIVMGPTTLESPKAAMSPDTFHLGFFLMGAVILFGLEKLKVFTEACK